MNCNIADFHQYPYALREVSTGRTVLRTSALPSYPKINSSRNRGISSLLCRSYKRKKPPVSVPPSVVGMPPWSRIDGLDEAPNGGEQTAHKCPALPTKPANTCAVHAVEVSQGGGKPHLDDRERSLSTKRNASSTKSSSSEGCHLPELVSSPDVRTQSHSADYYPSTDNTNASYQGNKSRQILHYIGTFSDTVPAKSPEHRVSSLISAHECEGNHGLQLPLLDPLSGAVLVNYDGNKEGCPARKRPVSSRPKACLFVGSREFPTSNTSQRSAVVSRQSRRPPPGYSASESWLSYRRAQECNSSPAQLQSRTRFDKFVEVQHKGGVHFLDHMQVANDGRGRTCKTGPKAKTDCNLLPYSISTGPVTLDDCLRPAVDASVPVYRHSDCGSGTVHRHHSQAGRGAELRVSVGDEVALLARRLREDWYSSKKPIRHECDDEKRRMEFRSLANQTLEYARKNPERFRV